MDSACSSPRAAARNTIGESACGEFAQRREGIRTKACQAATDPKANAAVEGTSAAGDNQENHPRRGTSRTTLMWGLSVASSAQTALIPRAIATPVRTSSAQAGQSK